MSISLPTNKEEKRQRLIMLVKQDSLTVIQANKLFADYCRLYDRVRTDNIAEHIKELSRGYIK